MGNMVLTLYEAEHDLEDIASWCALVLGDLYHLLGRLEKVLSKIGNTFRAYVGSTCPSPQ
jgi:hypothetical protein